jgi:hypothetical protein
MRIYAEHASHHRNKKPAVTRAYGVFCGRLRTTPEGLLFSDAKSTEYLAQQIVRAEFAGNGT